MTTKTANCIECTTGAMAGSIPGTLANDERCDTCEVYATDREARLAILNAELLKACRQMVAVIGNARHSHVMQLSDHTPQEFRELFDEWSAAIANAEGTE